jgi:hypothetical protein
VNEEKLIDKIPSFMRKWRGRHHILKKSNMPKKETDNFRKDILKITKSQDEKIANLDNLIKDQADHTEGILKEILARLNVAPQPQVQAQQADIQTLQTKGVEACSLNSVFDPRLGLTQEQMNQRNIEAIKIIKPIMKQYGMAQMRALFSKKQ